jgi:hypothetical protein
MTLLCSGFGVLFLILSAYWLGLVFIAVGALSEVLCLYLGRSRCQRRFDTQRLTG